MHSQALTKVVIPSTVKTIEGSAFNSCTSLTDIVIPSSVTTLGGTVFNVIPSITVHVPWKIGEKPDGWDENWAYISPDCTITIDYAK